jgi:hypothetical protein
MLNVFDLLAIAVPFVAVVVIVIFRPGKVRGRMDAGTFSGEIDYTPYNKDDVTNNDADVEQHKPDDVKRIGGNVNRRKPPQKLLDPPRPTDSEDLTEVGNEEEAEQTAA